MFHELNIIRKDIAIEALQSKVFAAWSDPEHIAGWFTDEVSGWPGVGSTMSFRWKNFGFSVDYKLAEMRPDTKLIYKTRLPGVGTQVLTVKLARRAPFTIVNISESGPENHKSDPMESGVDSGWTMSLSILKYYIDKQFGKKRECFFAMLPAHFEFPQIRELFSTREGLEKWLTLQSPPPTKIGDDYRFRLDSGQILSGKVLAITHHELSLSWDEIDGYLELKSFPTGEGNKGLCLRGATYSPEKFPVSGLETEVKDALVKLFAALSS